MSSTTLVTVCDSSARQSSHIVAAEAMTLVPPGSTLIRPTVVTQPSRSAASRAASMVCAIGTTGS